MISVDIFIKKKFVILHPEKLNIFNFFTYFIL